jgi:hypothetical protein
MATPSPTGPSEVREIQVGPHVVGFEPPDTYIIHQAGDFTKEEATGVCDALESLVGGKKAVFGIVEGDVGRVSAEGRKVLVTRMPKATVGLVFVNFPTIARIGMSLGYKAYIMISHGRQMPHTFVETGDEARAWVAEQRQRLTSIASGDEK